MEGRGNYSQALRLLSRKRLGHSASNGECGKRFEGIPEKVKAISRGRELAAEAVVLCSGTEVGWEGDVNNDRSTLSP